MNRCAGCGRMERRDGQYLCPEDWFRITPRQRARLRRKDASAPRRLRELYRQIGSGIPLEEIEVSP